MTHRAYGMEVHNRCPTPDDCVCACPVCLLARAKLIERQRAKEDKFLKEASKAILPHYQTITLVLSDGRRVHYTGRAQIDHINPPRVVEVLVSISEPLPSGMTWDVMPTPKEGKDKCR